MACTSIDEGDRGYTNPIFPNSRKKVFAGAQKTFFVVVLGLLTPNKKLQAYITGIVAIEILFSQTRLKDRAEQLKGVHGKRLKGTSFRVWVLALAKAERPKA